MLDVVVIGHDAQIVMRAETVTHWPFLDDLTATCSPLVGLVPDDMIRRQVAFQRLGHSAAYPTAMRRVVMCANQPIGRLVIDWAPDHSRCVDIAIVPAARGAGIGTALLAAWLGVVDGLGQPASLSVRRDNPAVALYRRLGFTENGDDDASMLAPMLDMVRAR